MKRILFLTILSCLLLVACAGMAEHRTEPLVDYTSTVTSTLDSTINEYSETTLDASIPEISGAEESLPPPEDLPFSIKLSFTGDMMLACLKDETTSGSFNEYTNNNPPEYFLANVRNIFESDDFTLVNLENVFSDNNLKERPKSGDRVFWFKSATRNTQILTSSGVEGVSLANNHTNDYGEQGYKDTVDAVTNAGLQYGLDDQIIYFEKNGFTVAFLCVRLYSSSYTEDIINLLNVADSQSDYQVVFFHGGTESIHKPETWKQESAHKLVDNGADLVIGAHPHVLQPREVYNGVEIIYSLGNFCYGGHRKPENRTIIYQMQLNISPDNKLISTESTIIPCYVFTGSRNNYQPSPIVDETEKQYVLDFIDKKRNKPY